MLDINLNNFHKEMSMFTGTEAYHRWTPLSKGVLTDGSKYVAEQLQAYWLFDAIASHIDFGDLPDLDMYFSTLTTFNKTGTLSLEDGNGREIALQNFDYTDCPLTGIKIWSVSTDSEERGPFFVHMLPSEY